MDATESVDLTGSDSSRLDERRRLEAAGEVAAGIAHELRNPLYGISSAAQLLRFRSHDDPVVERNIGRILREVERLNALVADLLEYGRPRPLALVPGDPDAVWDYVLAGNRGVLESASLRLRREREESAEVRIDGERLGQVFLNLLIHAAEGATPGSTITLRSGVDQDGAWWCTLHRAGAQLPEESLARAFEIFSATRQSGTGIGLPLCRRIVDEHGGRIMLASSAEDGTTFTVRLPALVAVPRRSPVRTTRARGARSR